MNPRAVIGVVILIGFAIATGYVMRDDGDGAETAEPVDPWADYRVPSQSTEQPRVTQPAAPNADATPAWSTQTQQQQPEPEPILTQRQREENYRRAYQERIRLRDEADAAQRQAVQQQLQAQQRQIDQFQQNLQTPPSYDASGFSSTNNYVVPIQTGQHYQAPAQHGTQSATVYATNTGEKYHRDGCRYLKQSRIAISLDDAIARGLTACSVCKP